MIEWPYDRDITQLSVQCHKELNVRDRMNFVTIM